MSSVLEKEKIREELRNAHEELLRKGKRDVVDQTNWGISKKLGDNVDRYSPVSKRSEVLHDTRKSKKSKKNKKEKKAKKHNKKEKKKRKKKDSCSDSSDTEDVKEKRKQNRCASNSSSTSSDEWVEKKVEYVGNTTSTQPLVRDTWMTEERFILPTYCKNTEVQNEKRKPGFESYDPSKSSRELNPYWKDGGKGIPAFQKPKEDEEWRKISEPYNKGTSRNWKKKITKQKPESSHEESGNIRENIKGSKKSISSGSSNEDSRPNTTFLSDQQMNELGAKLIKAEIMGDDKTAEQLLKKLENARKARDNIKDNRDLTKANESQQKEEHILLTMTDNKGVTRPLLKRDSRFSDPYEKGKGKRKKAETHISGERVKYFPDDDRYDIKQMFEQEKHAAASDSDAQFAKIVGKYKSGKDDLDDVFADNIRKDVSEHERGEKERKRAIDEYERFTNVLDSCDKCFNSPKTGKELMVCMGSTVYLSLPWHEGLQPGHCLVIPIQHVSCSTQLDEDIWREISDFRKALTRMFASRSQEVVFFETARYLNKRPHMAIHCIPSSSKNFEMAPFYFKKAIQESEQMWSTNKQLIPLKDRDVRRAIPKGLPYFWIQFGMGDGFAHVIEDQEKFPANFAQEIIGGMLELDPKTWRKPRKEYNSIQKVKQFVDWWRPFDITSQ